MRHIGIVIADRGSAIVTVERGDDDALLVTGIERLPFDLSAVTERVRALTVPDDRYVIDGEGLGGALWAVLGHEHDRDWTLYTGRGLERQALVDDLLVAVQEDRFRFAAGLDEQEAMSKALVGYRRQVRDDGRHRLRAGRRAAARHHPAAAPIGLRDQGPADPVSDAGIVHGSPLAPVHERAPQGGRGAQGRGDRTGRVPGRAGAEAAPEAPAHEHTLAASLVGEDVPIVAPAPRRTKTVERETEIAVG